MFPKGVPVIKRCFDLLASALGLVLIWPLLLALALLVRVRLGRPVIFKQLRPGYRCKPFYLFKFRSMSEAHDEQGRLLPDEQRLTMTQAAVDSAMNIVVTFQRGPEPKRLRRLA